MHLAQLEGPRVHSALRERALALPVRDTANMAHVSTCKTVTYTTVTCETVTASPSHILSVTVLPSHIRQSQP